MKPHCLEDEKPGEGQLAEVERLIEKLKKKGEIAGKPAKSLSELSAYAIEDDLPTDLAEQHDHYLYGTPKK